VSASRFACMSDITAMRTGEEVQFGEGGCHTPVDKDWT
jgi:hypothetical protein